MSSINHVHDDTWRCVHTTHTVQERVAEPLRMLLGLESTLGEDKLGRSPKQGRYQDNVL